MANPNDPINQNPNVNIINQPNQPTVQANQPFQNRQRGTGFTNINRILGANVGAGQQLAGRIGGAITGQGARVRQNLGQAQQQFQTGFQKARQEALANVTAGSELVKQPGESDEQYEARVATQAPNYSQIGQNLRSAAYGGPTGFENPNVLLSQARTAGKLGTFTGSGIGQGILARQYGAGRGNYGVGQNILDQMFLSQDPTAQQSLRQARQSVTGLGKEITEASSAAAEAAQAAASGIEQEKAKAFTGLEQSARGIQERGAQAAKQFYVDRDRFNQLLTAKKETDEQGNVKYRDSSGNILNLTDRDYQLIGNPQQFGLESEGLFVDPRFETTTQSILQDIANSGITTNIGSLKYTPEQQAAIRNLMAISGKPAESYTPFETDVYRLDPTNIENKSQAYKDIKNERNELIRKETINAFQPSVDNALSGLNVSSLYNYWGIPSFTAENIPQVLSNLREKMNAYEQRAGRTMNWNNLRSFLDNNSQRLMDIYNSYSDKLNTEQQTQKGISLQNYLNQLYARSSNMLNVDNAGENT